MTQRFAAALAVAVVSLCGPEGFPGVFHTPVTAEEPAMVAELLPPGMPPLPSARDRNAGLLLVPDNIEPYRELFLPPVFEWIKKRKMVVRAVRGLDHVWKLNDAWETASHAEETRLRLTPDHGIERNPAAKEALQGFPFGDRSILAKENDPELRARKILWNILFTAQMNEEMRYSFEMTWSGSQILRRRADAFWYGRFFPQVQDDQPYLSQWVLRFLTPPNSQNYSVLSWQSRDSSKNHFWIYSPPIQRLRELLPANRSDGILASSMSADDLFVWSGDPRRFSARVLEERVLFVLFPSVRAFPLVVQTSEVLAPETAEAGRPAASPSGTASPTPKPAPQSVPALAVSGLRERPLGGGSSAVLWNYDSKQFPQLAPWVPLSASAVPRKVWVIELVPKDPFYESGRELLYVDQEMMLPVMKVTYDRIGEFQRTVIGGWGLAEKKDRSVVFPFFGFAFAAEQDAAAVTALTTTGVRRYTPKDLPGLRTLRNLLQPESYGKPRETPAPPKTGEAGKPAAKEEKPEVDPAEGHALAID